MAMVEYHLNGKKVLLDDSIDESETGIAIHKNEEENQDKKEDFNENTQVFEFGENDEK